jgi:hypothetical protein
MHDSPSLRTAYTPFHIVRTCGSSDDVADGIILPLNMALLKYFLLGSHSHVMLA